MEKYLQEALAVVAECWPGECIDSQITTTLTATYGEHSILEMVEIDVPPLFPHGTRCFMVLFRHAMENGKSCNHVSMVSIYGKNQIAVDAISISPVSNDKIIRVLLDESTH